MSDALCQTASVEHGAPVSGADAAPRQQEMPFAVVHGEKLFELPKDLYIPPDALEVLLETFEGPLDLLLYLIRKQNLDILDIPIAQITAQYMRYLDMMAGLKLELAGEYLLMAAMLAEIKSRMLLPRPVSEDEAQADPRAELIGRLQEYERYRQAGEDLDALPRLDRDVWCASCEVSERNVVRLQPAVALRELLDAFVEVMRRGDQFAAHKIDREPLSVRERMTQILAAIGNEAFTRFVDLFEPDEGKGGVVVTFLSILELMRESLLDIVQSEPYAPIYVRART